MDYERIRARDMRRSFQQRNTSEENNLTNKWNGVDLGQNQYDFRYLVFPQTLGLDDNGHYMVININSPIELFSEELVGDYNREYSTAVENPRAYSKVDRLRQITLGSFNISIGPFNISVPTYIPRRTRRIKESIALYMPSPLVFNHNNVYEEISLTALGGKLMIGTSSLLQGLAKDGATFINKLLGAAAPAILGPGGQEVVSTGSQLMQSPINPMVEILFTTTDVRAFTFELLLAPRNEKESDTLYSIIKTLRFHSVGEYGGALGTNLLNNFQWIPPGEFDITFYNKGVENLNILKINTCVMERIEVDYSPSGVYSTFRNGHPVAVRLSMGFRELEPLHKERVAQGF